MCTMCNCAHSRLCSLLYFLGFACFFTWQVPTLDYCGDDCGVRLISNLGLWSLITVFHIITTYDHAWSCHERPRSTQIKMWKEFTRKTQLHLFTAFYTTHQSQAGAPFSNHGNAPSELKELQNKSNESMQPLPRDSLKWVGVTQAVLVNLQSSKMKDFASQSMCR